MNDFFINRFVDVNTSQDKDGSGDAGRILSKDRSSPGRLFVEEGKLLSSSCSVYVPNNFFFLSHSLTLANFESAASDREQVAESSSERHHVSSNYCIIII